MTPTKSDHEHDEMSFLDRMNLLADGTGERTDELLATRGEKVPATTREFGSLLWLLYQMACCRWGCSGGDHRLEWLAGLGYLGSEFSRHDSIGRLERQGSSPEAAEHDKVPPV